MLGAELDQEGNEEKESERKGNEKRKEMRRRKEKNEGGNLGVQEWMRTRGLASQGYEEARGICPGKRLRVLKNFCSLNREEASLLVGKSKVLKSSFT